MESQQRLSDLEQKTGVTTMSSGSGLLAVRNCGDGGLAVHSSLSAVHSCRGLLTVDNCSGLLDSCGGFLFLLLRGLFRACQNVRG